MKIGQWRIGRGSYGQMRPKSTGLGQMGGFILGSRRWNHFQTGPPPPLSSMEEGIMLWYGGVWGGMGREAHRYRGSWMHSNTVIFWMMEWWKVLRGWRYQRRRGYSSRTMTPNTPLKRQHSGLRTMTSKCLSGLPNPLILTLLSTSGCI